MESRFTEEFLKRDKALFDIYLESFVKKFNTRIAYGTAGFRIEAKYLEHIAFRSGIFAAYLAAYSGGVIGVQITASHNPLQDNGIKFIGRDGLMMKTDFEKPVEEFANIEGLRDACTYLDNFFFQLGNGQPLNWDKGAFTLIGCDTRSSSPTLLNALKEGITYTGGKFLDFGTVTTPQLHYMVLEFNRLYAKDLPKFDYDPKTLLEAYYKHFGGTLLEAFSLLADMGLVDKNHRKKTYVDCSNGVGGIHQEKLTAEYFNKIFDCVVYNTNEIEALNVDCGSEFVQKEKKVPKNLLDLIEKQIPADVDLDTISFISYDGDADRSVAYRVQRGNKEADLFEGDKIGALYALFCQRTLSKINELQTKLKDVVDVKADFSKWTIGAALTAYANGSAQKFYRDTLKVTLMIEPTGVKYLHRAAENFDIGVYFESNGHGTVVFDHEKIHHLRDAVQIAYENLGKSEAHKADLLALYQQLKLLYLFLVEANQGVGDAISNYLQIETALAALGLNAGGWKKIYTDLENAHSKIKVKNRFAIKVNYDQSKIISPPEIQPKIDEICSKYEMGRAFLRPSGTEDIVRCYVEATKFEDVQEIQKQIHEFLLNNKSVN